MYSAVWKPRHDFLICAQERILQWVRPPVQANAAVVTSCNKTPFGTVYS